MLKSFMTYFDIIFPLNLGPLTYRCPEKFLKIAKPGTLVSAPLKNSLKKGIIIRKTPSPPDGRIKEFSTVHEDSPVLSKGMLKLLAWMADYYIAPEGLVLKQTLSPEVFSRTRLSKARKIPAQEMHFEPLSINNDAVSQVLQAVNASKYRTFLLHAPSVIYEYSFIRKILASSGNAIIVLPEIAQAELVFNICRQQFRDRVCLLHSALSKGRRSAYIDGILSGKHDIVIGTRAALFAPLKNVSLVALLNEHSSSYKQEEGIRYHIRDVAVMRGFIEKSVVLLSSVTPTVDSFFNALTNKYDLMRPHPSPKRPKIRIINMRFEKMVRPNFSKTVHDLLKKRLKEGRRTMLVINRRGYATLLHCTECGHTETCPACNIPLVLHRREGTLKCHYCGLSLTIPGLCNRCRSARLQQLGTGTERLQENMQELFKVKTVRFDSDRVKKKSEIQDLMQITSSDSTKVIIGTKMMTKRIGITDMFSSAVVFSMDSALNHPDFRATEKAYAELSSVMQHVEPDGEVFIQTRFPQNHLFHHFKSDDYAAFVREEIAMRKELGFPPFAKLLKLDILSNDNTADTMQETLVEQYRDIEVLGPIPGKKIKDREEQSILLKSKDRKRLNVAARKLLSEFKDAKDIQIRIDVDPA
jgi:primosomal protein N' (replication factor Y)